MDSTFNPEELARQISNLNAQVAALQQQISALHKLFDIEGDPFTSLLHLRCASLTLCDPQNNERPSARLTHDANGPRLTLLTSEGQSGLELAVDAATGRGQATVFDAGNPRVVLKAADIGGFVSVVHDDGRPRAFVFGDAAHGEVVSLAADTEASVKLSCDKSHGGGLITVSANNSKPAVALTATHEGGAVVVLRKEGSVGCSLATMEKVSGITVSDRGQGQLHMLSDASGPSMRLTDSEGRSRISLHQTAQGSFINLDSNTDQPLLSLSALAGQPALTMDNGQGDRINLQTTQDGGGVLAFANPPDKPQLLLIHSKAGPSIALQPQSDRGAAATLACTKEGGALFICDPEGTRRCGLCATDDGSQLMLFNDLGIERVLLGSAQDGGALKLNWGGTMGVAALATQEGGAVVVNDSNGHPRASLPPGESESE